MEKHNRIRNIIEKNWFRYMVASVFVIGIMTVIWQVRLQYEFPREEQILESSGSLTFSPQFKQIHDMGFSCDDIEAPWSLKV